MHIPHCFNAAGLCHAGGWKRAAGDALARFWIDGISRENGPKGASGSAENGGYVHPLTPGTRKSMNDFFHV